MTEMLNIHWPAIIHHGTDDELLLVRDSDVYLSDECQEALELGARLIDIDGNIYHLSVPGKHDSAILVKANQQLTLAEFEELVKRHLVVAEQCCIAKIQLGSYRQGFMLVEQTVT